MIVPIGTVDIWVEIVSAQAAISASALWAFADEGAPRERVNETAVSS
jgi:hypothetical protein